MLNVSGRFFVLAAARVQGTLRLVDRVLPSLTLLLPGGLFLGTFALPLLLRLLESKCGLPVGRIVVGPFGSLPRLTAVCLLWTAAGEVSR